MKTSMIGRLMVVLTVGSLACADVSAATAKRSSGSSVSAAATSLAKAEIVAIDRDNLTITVDGPKGQKDQVIQITSQTRMFLGKKNATTADLKVGGKVSGSLRKGAGGKLEAVRLSLDDGKVEEKPAAKATKPAPKKP